MTQISYPGNLKILKILVQTKKCQPFTFSLMTQISYPGNLKILKNLVQTKKCQHLRLV